jgi:putative ATPase
MKELGYGKGYKYAHSFTGGHVPQDYLPQELTGRHFYKPTRHGYEKLIRERMEQLARPPAEGEEGQ